MRTALLRLFFVLTLASGGLGLATENTTVNFTGQWILNTKLSDPIQPARPEGGRQQGGMSGGGGGRGGGGRGGGGGGGRGSHAGGSGQQPSVQDQQRAVRMQQELSRLEIFQDGIELNVTNGMDISRLLYTDGRTMNIWTQRGEAQAIATWEDRTLTVQWKTRTETMSRLRRYSLSDNGLQLTVTEKRRLPKGDKYREMTLIYDKTD